MKKNKKSEKVNYDPLSFCCAELRRGEGEVNIKMAEEKMMGKCCGHAGKKYMLFGVLAVVYGVINYLTSVMGWQPYMAWITGGVILLLIAWAKGSMKA